MVRERDRGISDMEFYKQGLKLRQALQLFLERDLEYKGIENSVSTYSPSSINDLPVYNFNEKGGGQEVKQFVVNNTKFEKVTKRMHVDMVEESRKYLISLARDIMKNIVKANSLYIGVNCKKVDCDKRTELQSDAIECVNAMLEELFELLPILPYDLNKIDELLEIADTEISLLTKWKNSDYVTIQKNLKLNQEQELLASSSNFSNANNNGNANNNNASNVNGVRPRFIPDTLPAYDFNPIQQSQ